MLTLPIMKKWADMILSGEKKEEYRAMSRYWATRFRKVVGSHDFNRALTGKNSQGVYTVKYQVGYNNTGKRFLVNFRLRTGYGKKEWGAEEGVKYFIVGIENIEVIK